MGLNINATRLLLQLRSTGFDFGQVLTLGRQRLNLRKSELQKNLGAFGYNEDARSIKQKNNGYCEPFLEMLGATRIDSMDVSDYEQPTLQHDLNQPIAEVYKASCDTLIDSGTLEHVFNFPVAIKSCMEIIRPGGHYIGITPCNNFF